MTKTPILDQLRDYLRERAAEVGFAVAMDEIDDAVAHIQTYGTSEKRHVMIRAPQPPTVFR